MMVSSDVSADVAGCDVNVAGGAAAATSTSQPATLEAAACDVNVAACDVKY